MENVGLKIVLEADTLRAAKAIETVVTAIETIPAATTSASKGVERFTVSVEKAEKPLFDLDKAVKDATSRINANIDRMAAEAINGNQKLEASIGPVITAFSKLKAAQGSVGVFKDVYIAGFIKPLNYIQPAANKAATSLDKLGKAGEKNGQVLLNVGRVLSDSPYGFIGIANNIEPLLESFRRLQTETGSTKNAFKSLLSGLAGGGGLGLAFSAALAAVQFISLGFDRWTGSTKAATKATKEAADEVKNFAESAAQDIVKVNALASIADDTTRSYKDRKEAISALRKEYPEYLKGLSDEQALTIGVQGAVDSLTVSLVRRGILLAQQDKINKVIAQSLEDITTQVKDQREQFRNYGSGPDNPFKKVDDDVKEFGTDVTTNFGKATDAINKTSAATKTYTLLTKQQQDDAAKNSTAIEVFGKIKTLLKDAIQDLLSFGAATDDFVKTPLEKAGKAAKETNKQVKELSSVIGGFLGALDSSGSLGKNRLIIKFAAEFEKADTEKNIKDLVKFINEDVKPTVTLRMDANIQAALDGIKAVQDKAIAFANSISSQINAVISQAIASAAEGIGEAIAGNSNGLTKFLEVIANGLAGIGQAMIAFGIAKIALSKAITGPQAVAIGVGLEILAGVLKAKINKTRFADGGIVTGPTNALIGEAGPEVVFPLDRIREFMGNDRGSMQPIVLTTAVRGSDLLLVQQRAGASYGRTNG